MTKIAAHLTMVFGYILTPWMWYLFTGCDNLSYGCDWNMEFLPLILIITPVGPSMTYFNYTNYWKNNK